MTMSFLVVVVTPLGVTMRHSSSFRHPHYRGAIHLMEIYTCGFRGRGRRKSVLMGLLPAIRAGPASSCFPPATTRSSRGHKKNMITFISGFIYEGQSELPRSAHPAVRRDTEHFEETTTERQQYICWNVLTRTRELSGCNVLFVVKERVVHLVPGMIRPSW